MKNIVLVSAMLMLALVGVGIQPIRAQEVVSEPSAQINLSQLLEAKKDEIVTYQSRREAMIRVLTRYNSPLVNHVDSFIEATDRYQLEDYFLISIAGVESTFAQRMINGTYNAYGYGRGRIAFDSWEHGIDTLGFKLRENYINRGALTIEQIGPRYAGGSTSWAPKVRFFMSQFKQEEDSIREMHQYL